MAKKKKVFSDKGQQWIYNQKTWIYNLDSSLLYKNIIHKI